MHEDDLPRPQSYLEWYVNSLGMPTLLLIVGATLVAMFLVVLLFVRGRGPAMPAAILFVLPLPLIVGVIALLAGLINSYTALSYSLSHTSRPAMGQMGYGFVSIMQASGCFCPLLLLTLTLLMFVGFRGTKSGL
jgi:hypothetical protein